MHNQAQGQKSRLPKTLARLTDVRLSRFPNSASSLGGKIVARFPVALVAETVHGHFEFDPGIPAIPTGVRQGALRRGKKGQVDTKDRETIKININKM